MQGRSPVLAGQARRSGGALAYTGFAEFEAALDVLLDDPAAGARLGAAGRAYIERRYAWPAVLDRYEHLLGCVGAPRGSGAGTSLPRFP